MPEPRDLEPLLGWYFRVRRDMPWRRTRDPYAVWVSETMLQQTRVDTVVSYYERFVSRWPTVQSLAEASEDAVLTAWSGLGYYRRARMLHAAAKRVVGDHRGRFPSTADELRGLEGIGRYTAGAVASIAFGQRAALVDGNVARVIARLFAIEQDVKGQAGSRQVWAIAERLMARVDAAPGDWNQALMELGATVCTPREPACGDCPVATACEGKLRGLERRLPLASPKRPPIPLRRVSIVLASKSAVLLARRRRDGLFGGLWEPPAADEGEASGRALRNLARQLGVDAGALRPIGQVEHVLSHRRMHVSVARGDLGRRRRWPIPSAEYEAIEVVSLDRLDAVGHASLTLKVLALAELAKPRPRGLRSTR